MEKADTMTARSYVGGRILIVSDELFHHNLLPILHHNYDLLSARNGVEALEMLRNEAFDLVLLAMTPVVKSIQTLTDIRANAGLVDLPVLIISAISETEQVVDAMTLGAHDYLTDPLDASMLMTRVQTLVTFKHLMDEQREALAALKAANQLKSRMMQVAAHDLRNLLNNLNLLLRVVKTGYRINQASHLSCQ
jgi:DNA-binding response OmpR family regulator